MDCEPCLTRGVAGRKGQRLKLSIWSLLWVEGLLKSTILTITATPNPHQLSSIQGQRRHLQTNAIFLPFQLFPLRFLSHSPGITTSYYHFSNHGHPQMGLNPSLCHKPYPCWLWSLIWSHFLRVQFFMPPTNVPRGPGISHALESAKLSVSFPPLRTKIPPPSQVSRFQLCKEKRRIQKS